MSTRSRSRTPNHIIHSARAVMEHADRDAGLHQQAIRHYRETDAMVWSGTAWEYTLPSERRTTSVIESAEAWAAHQLV